MLSYLGICNIEIINSQEWRDGRVEEGLRHLRAGQELHLGGDDGVHQGTEEEEDQKSSGDHTDSTDQGPDKEAVPSYWYHFDWQSGHQHHPTV